MRPKSVRKYSISSVAKRALKGRPIKIGGGDGGFITDSAMIHRRRRLALDSKTDVDLITPIDEKV